ncbi:MAG: YhcH/YjgK/YiaL family protein [Desulfovibrio sp.]|nr:YhcH/YjgK/YiaL family protein [Desulfovibrio sp.]
MSVLYSFESSRIPSIMERLSRFSLSRSEYVPYERSERRYEVHRCFIDVQFLTRGVEELAICSASSLSQPLPFDTARDIGFFEDRAEEDALIRLRPGLFCVIYPGEAHMPCLLHGENREPVEKYVAKIPLSLLASEPDCITRLFQ